MNTGRVDINQVLMQMRAIKTQMPAQPLNEVQNTEALKPSSQVRDALEATGKVEPPSFGDMFKSAVDTVNNNQSQANDLSQRYELGDPNVDLPEVMIALQKSSVSFQAMTEVRNKMVEAYKQIMNMPL